MNFKEKKSWQSIATAPRKSYLGKLQNITPSQKRWIKYILNMWGDKMGGSCVPARCVSVIGRLMVREEWAENKGQLIVKTVNEFYKLGYRGDELFKKVREIIIPKSSFSELLKNAQEDQDAKFVDAVIAKTFDVNSPLRIVAKKYYCERRSIKDIADYLSIIGGVLITEKMARDRVKWCLELFDAKVYKAISYEIKREVNTLIT
ncbi:hypothetical protein [Orbus mooreae]|uniref:hypothetical protein n=1 Tax=Orbus mooreae TaxID=3074107 RepID=UPI00370DC88E